MMLGARAVVDCVPPKALRQGSSESGYKRPSETGVSPVTEHRSDEASVWIASAIDSYRFFSSFGMLES
jgi:hypothetical protein